MCICVGDLHQKRPACYEKTLLIPQIIGAKGPHLPSLLNPFLQMLPCPLGIGLSVCVLWELITASGSGSMRIARRWTDTWASCACKDFIFAFTYFYPSLQLTSASLANNKSFHMHCVCEHAGVCVCVCVIQLTCGLDFLWGQTHANAGRLVLNRGCCDPALKLKHTLLLKQRNLMDMFVFWINDGVLWLLGGGLQIQNLKKERKSQM